MKLTRLWLSGLILLFAGISCKDQPDKDLLIIRGATIIDPCVEGGIVASGANAYVLISSDTIAGYGQLEEDEKLPAVAELIDATGKYVMPGLIDGFAVQNNQDYASAFLYMGVTSLIGVEGGRRGDFFFDASPGPDVYMLESVGDDQKSTEEHISDLLALHSNGYRVALLKYALKPGQVVELKRKANELGMVCIGELGHTSYREGAEAGLEAFVHTTRYALDIAPRDLAESVAREPFSDDLNSPKWKYYRFLASLEEGDPGLSDHAEMLAASQTFLMPTFSLLYLDKAVHSNPWNWKVASMISPETINNPADKQSGNHRYDSLVQSNYHAIASNQYTIEKAFYNAGAEYLAGSATDVWGTMPGISLHTELQAFQEIGLSNQEVLATATSNFHKAFGWKTGRMKTGFRANLLILDDNPLENLEHLRTINQLVLRGKVLDRDGLLKKEAQFVSGPGKSDADIVSREAVDLKQAGDLQELIFADGSKELKPRYRYLDSIKTERIRYISSGLEVVGYMAYPAKEGKYPAVIYNRGGNTGFGQISNVKLARVLARVASWGYVVVGSQYRGNDGGQGREEFGGADVHDVLNLIPLVKRLPNVDSSRLGIYGWSRGGMMTYLALMETSEFKAACVGGGLSDLHMMKQTRPNMEEVYMDLIPDYEKKKEETLKARSAIQNVEKLPRNTPILLLHGTADWRVVPQMALDLSSEFIRYRIPHRLVMFEGGNHGLTEFEEDVDNYVMDWFRRYLKEGEELPDLEPHGR